jgi:hypothetical protein
MQRRSPLWTLWIQGHLLALICTPVAPLALSSGGPHPSYGLLALAGFSVLLAVLGGVFLMMAWIQATSVVHQGQHWGWFLAFMICPYVAMWCYFLRKGPTPSDPIGPISIKEFWLWFLKCCNEVISRMKKYF